MGSITNRDPNEEQARQQKTQDNKAKLLKQPGVNKADQSSRVRSGRATGHLYDKENEKRL